MTGRAVVLRGDARSLPLPDECVDLIVTSPPYFGLRSYTDGGEHYGGQIGSEATPAEFLAALLACTAEWVRVLKPSGSIFVNLGDKYSGVGGSNGHGWCIDSDSTRERRAKVRVPLHQGRTSISPAKSLMGLPWRYALGCVDDLGLILRRDIIWRKVNSLPESVTDRCRSSHEYLFHLTKQPRYFAAIDELREPHQPQSIARTRRNRFAPDLSQNGVGSPNTLSPGDSCNPLGKLPGSVWEIPSQPLIVPDRLGVDHFAAFPAELPKRCILGWSPRTICLGCGEGWRPVSAVTKRKPNDSLSIATRARTTTASGTHVGSTLGYPAEAAERRIIGYACACPPGTPYRPTRPGLIVDPFGGTGTTALVASVLGRNGISIDRSADYCRLATWRVSDPGERARALGIPKPPPVPDGQASLFDLTGESA